MAFLLKQQIFEAIEKSENILIAFNKNFNGDHLGGAIALMLWLQKKDKKVDIVCDNYTTPSGYSFLSATSDIKKRINNLRKFIITLDISKTKVDEISYDVKGNELEFVVSPKEGFFEETDISSKTSGFKYDLIFILGTSDLESLGKIYDNDTGFFYQTPIINIDNMPANEKFGQINLINLTAAANCEILFDLIVEKDQDLIDENVATALLTGIITSTNNFKKNKVTPATLNTAGRLISLGAKRSEIVQNLYQARSLSTLKLWGRTLARLRNDAEYKLAWSLISTKDFELTQSKEEILDDVIAELIANSYEVETIVLLYEPINNKTSDNQVNIIVASLKNIDSFSLVEDFIGAEGDEDKAKLSLNNVSLNEAEEQVISKIKEKLKALEGK